MKREIVDFEQDDEQHWVAILSCGHRQHVRHQPPMTNRLWVLSEEGRTSKVGLPLECPYCDMPSLPASVVAYKETPIFDETNVPPGLLQNHRTKAEVWGRIVVLKGIIRYVIEDALDLPLGVKSGAWHLRSGVEGVIPPQVAHRVTLQPGARFQVFFCKKPQEK